MAAKYDADIPTWPDPNSRDAAAAAKANIAYRRKYICWRIGNEPDAYSCWDFCEGYLKSLGHGGVSGTISGLVKHGLLLRSPERKRNGRGQREWAYRLHPTIRANWQAIDWDMSLEDLANTWDLL